MKICKNCIFDENIPNIYFDSLGVCNYCKQIEEMKAINFASHKLLTNDIDPLI